MQTYTNDILYNIETKEGDIDCQVGIPVASWLL